MQTHKDRRGDDDDQEYFCLPGGVAEREIEADIRAWVAAVLYSLAGVDLTALPKEMLPEFVLGAVCVPRGESLGSTWQAPVSTPQVTTTIGTARA